jgi:type IV secretion system protein VirD4
MYRVPGTPGFIGSYDWRATLSGLFLLLAFSSLATQHIAMRFRYQAALGPPLVRTPNFAIYQPFRWVAWGWRYCSIEDSSIRKPLFEGEMIVLVGSFLSVAAFFMLAGRRARRLSKDSEDLHGSARWAVDSDVKATGPAGRSTGRVRRGVV